MILNCFKDLQPAFGQEHQLEREPRSNKYIELPNGHPCMLNPSWGTDTTFVVSDNGTELTCDLCGMGKVLVSNCTSDTFTKCQLLKPGMQRMPHPNFCTTGYPCKACPGPSLTVKKLCDPHGWEDTKCECAKGYFSVNHEADLCQPMPRCSKGFEPRPGASEDGAEMICQKCGHGFYQPNDNSTDLCRRHTNCITTPGTDVSDNICKGDPQSSASPATSSNEGVPSLQPTMPSTQVPTGPSSPTPAAITEPPDPTGVPKPVNETDPKVVYANKVPVEWCVVALVTHVLCFVGGIVFKNSYDQCKKKKGECHHAWLLQTILISTNNMPMAFLCKNQKSRRFHPHKYQLGTYSLGPSPSCC